MKKYIKEAIILSFLAIISTNLISWYRSKNIKSNNLEFLKNYKSIKNEDIKKLIELKKILILNFWGTWCPVCNQEIFTINKISKDKDIILVTIAVNSGSNKEIKKFLKEKGVNFLVINDKNGNIASKFNIEVYPTTIFYNIKRDKSIKDSGYLSYIGYLARKKLIEESK